MKQIKQTLPLFFAVIIFLNFGCQKTTDVVNSNAQTNDLNTQKFQFCNHCPITSLTDFSGFQFHFFYNQKGNPDSIYWDSFGFYQKLNYDKWNRLTSIFFGTPGVEGYSAWWIFNYRHFDALPVSINYYNPSLGGLFIIDSFQYDLFGKITHRFGNQFLSPQYNYDEHYTYDGQGNIVKVDVKSHNGGTVYTPDLLELKVSKFDDKPNIMSGSIWLRYIFFYTPEDATPVYYNSFSSNNAKNFQWFYDLAKDSYTVKSALTYDKQNFAVEDDMDFYDNTAQTDLGVLPSSATSACDETSDKNAKPNSPSIKIKNSRSVYFPSTTAGR